jgi:hypothetical protein
MLTKKQRDVARAMYDGVLDEDKIQAKYGISSRQMKLWVEDEDFQQELYRLCANSMRETKFILTRYGPAAAWKLVELLNDEKGENTRRAALDLIDRCMQTNSMPGPVIGQMGEGAGATLTEDQAMRILETLSRGLRKSEE